MALTKKDIKELLDDQNRKIDQKFDIAQKQTDKKFNTFEDKFDKKFANFRIDIYSDMKNLLSPIKDKVDQLDKKIDKVKEMLEGDVSAAYEDIDKIKVTKLEATQH